MKQFFLLLFVAVLVGACKKVPEASFAPSIHEPLLGDTITMENASLNSESYIWTFGDGTTSTDESPVKVYELPGSYTVTLTSFSEERKRSSQAVQIIEIGEPEYYVYLKIDGESVVRHFAGDTIMGDSLRNTQASEITPGTPVSFGTYISKLETDVSDYFSIRKGILTWSGGTTPTNEEFAAFFTPGSYPYMDLILANGVEVNYWIGGVHWSSSKGASDQSESSFSIVSSEPYETDHFGVKVKCIFSCNIYNDAGQSKAVSGTFLGRFANKL